MLLLARVGQLVRTHGTCQATTTTEQMEAIRHLTHWSQLAAAVAAVAAQTHKEEILGLQVVPEAVAAVVGSDVTRALLLQTVTSGWAAQELRIKATLVVTLRI